MATTGYWGDSGAEGRAAARYGVALEKLATLAAPTDQPFESFAARALAIAAEFMRLPYALFAETDGERLRLACLAGAPPPGLTALALERAQRATDAPEDLCERGELAAFLGAGVRAAGRICGAIGFFSDQPPAGPIGEAERGFTRLVAQWIGLRREFCRERLSLRASEAEWLVTFDSVAQNIWRLDPRHRVRWANAGAAQAMGLSPENVIGADADAFMARLDPQWRAHAEAAIRAHIPHYGVEAPFKPKGEAPQWTSTDIVPDGEGALLVVSTDVTALKERETELEVAIADADHSRKLFERHYRRTPVLLCSFQSDGRIVEASDLWRDKTGYAREELIGRRLAEFMDEPSRRRAAEDILPALWRTGACEAAPLRFLVKSGGAMDAELSGYLSAEDGGPPLCLAALVDVTARNAAETALERANRELAAANVGLKKFAHIASHDLQEPLRKIAQFGDLLRSECGEALSGDALLYLEVMRDSTEQMRRLIRDILEFSRSMNANLARTRFALGDVVGEILDELDMAVRDAGARVEIGRLPSLYGDRTAAQLLLRNLISNSLKYRRPGVAPQVAIEGRWSRGEFVLSCRDNGCGIDERYHDSIFDPFTRLHMRSEVDGSGIGLAICKSVCDRQRWRIGVSSAPGQGAEFTVAIPAADVLAKPGEEATLG